MTGGTKPIPVTGPDGVEYPSFTAAAKALGYCKSTIRHHHISYGHLNYLGSAKVPVTWRGTDYPSQRAAAKAANVRPELVSTHINRYGHLDNLKPGNPLSKPRPAPEAKPVDVDGVAYPSMAAFADAVGVPANRARRWFRHGRTHLIMQAVIRAQERQRRAA